MKNLKPISLIFLLIQLILFPLFSCAQCDTTRYAHDSLQFVFCDNSGGNAAVITADRVGDTLYLGGNFRFVGRYSAGFMPVDSSSGAIYDQSWPRADGTVKVCVPDGNGGVIIGGNFERVGDVFTTGLAFIDSTGQVDASKAYNFYSQTGPLEVNDLLINNGILYVGGNFSSINSTNRNDIAAINISTGAITNWNPNCIGSRVNTLATDGTNIYVGGNFTNIASTSRNDLAAVLISTGNIVSGWNPNINTNNEIYKILIHGTLMFVSGDFTQSIIKVDLASGNQIAWNLTSARFVHDMVASGNRLYIGGTFTTVNSTTRNKIAVIDTASGSLLNWNPNITGGNVYSLTLVGDKIIAGGDFTTVGALQRKSVTRIDTSNGTVSALQIKNNPQTAVFTTFMLNNKLFVGGDFATIDGEVRNRLAAIDLHTNSLHSWTHDVFFNGSLSDGAIMVLKADNNILHIGGDFTHIDTYSRRSYAQVNLATDNITNTIPLNNAFARIASVVPHSSFIYLGGAFNVNINGTHESILRFNKSNNIVDTWAPTMPGNSKLGYVYDMDISGDNIYIAGDEIRNEWYGHSMLMKTNTVTGACSFLSNGSSSSSDQSYTVKVIDNKLYVGGRFSVIDSVNRKNLAVFDTSTLDIMSLNPLNNSSDPISDINTYKNRLCLVGDQISTGSSPQINRQGVALLDTANGAFIYGWQPEAIHSCHRILFFGDTAFVLGTLYKTNKKRLLGMARFHLNDTASSASISSPDTICANTSATFTINTSISGGSYQWRKNGTNVGTNSTTYTYTPSNGDVISCTIIPTTNNCMVTLDSLTAIDTVQVMANTTSTAQLTTSDDTVCAGTRVYFSVSTNIPSPVYQWKVGVANVGTNVDTFSHVPSNGNVISCTVTKPTGVCYTPASITVDTMINVISNTLPSITITDTASGSVCPGSPDNFVANTNIAGGSYQWRVNSSNVGLNTNTYNYYPANNDVVSCIITVPSNGGCYSKQKDTSNTITIAHLTPTVTNLTVTANNNPVCVGTQVSYSTTSNITGGSYQWRVNGNNTGTNASTHNYTPANNDIVSCVITAPVGCYIPDTAISSVTMTVNNKTSPTISITGPASMGEFGLVNLNANISNAGTNYTIDWTNNGNNFANTTVPNTSYTKGLGTDNIVATITPVGCYNTATSNTLTISEAVSIDLIDSSEDMLIYPNPTSTAINLIGAQKGDVVILYDPSGKKVIKEEISNTNTVNRFAVQNLPTGIYLLEIKSEDGQLKARKKIEKMQ